MKNAIGRAAYSVWTFYRDGFRNMTWGRPLWILIILKLIILFGLLRLFFFRPAMAGKSEEEKIEIVGESLTGGNVFLENNHKN